MICENRRLEEKKHETEVGDESERGGNERGEVIIKNCKCCKLLSTYNMYMYNHYKLG